MFAQKHQSNTHYQPVPWGPKVPNLRNQLTSDPANAQQRKSHPQEQQKMVRLQTKTLEMQWTQVLLVSLAYHQLHPQL